MNAPLSIDRVVMGFDGSGPSKTALRLAVDEARLREVPLLIVLAISTSPPCSPSRRRPTQPPPGLLLPRRSRLRAANSGTTV